MQTLLKNTQAYHLLNKDKAENCFAHAYLLLLNDKRNLKTALKTFAKLFFDCDDVQENTFLSPSEKREKLRISELIDNENFSDCLFFPSENKKLTVDDAERIKEESTLNPVETDKKVFLIGDFAEANVQTQNKLLKLLEEPPKGVIFLLGATSAFPVLATVLSRTKKLEILPFPDHEILSCLTRTYQDRFQDDVYELCAAASCGSFGEAQNILEGGKYKFLLDTAITLIGASESKLPALIKSVGETEYQKELVNLMRLIYRDVLLIKSQLDRDGKELLLRSEYSILKETAQKYTLSALLYAQEAISEAEKQIKFNAVFPQCLEICIANIQAKNKEKI